MSLVRIAPAQPVMRVAAMFEPQRLRFAEFPGGPLIGYNCSRFVRQGLDNIGGADDVVGVCLLPPPLLPAILLKTGVFPPVETPTADFPATFTTSARSGRRNLA